MWRLNICQTTRAHANLHPNLVDAAVNKSEEAINFLRNDAREHGVKFAEIRSCEAPSYRIDISLPRSTAEHSRGNETENVTPPA
jgi:precorrin-6B methylase 2